MKQQNRNTGNRGEAVACDLLRQKGYEILTRNYQNKWGEVDIVCVKGEYRVFVEVKTKTGEEFGEPWEMINKWKLEQVERMGHLWCEEYGFAGLCRIDVIGVWMGEDGEVEKIEHWEDVQL